MTRSYYCLLLALTILVNLAPETWALSVEEYCQLSIEILRASVDEGSEQLGAANQNAQSPRDYLAAVQTIRGKYRGIREQLYGKFGSSKQEYLNFMKIQIRAVESYLETHEEIRRQIEAVRSEAASRREQLESAIVNAGLQGAMPLNPNSKR